MTNSNANNVTTSPKNKLVEKLRPRASIGKLRTRKSSGDITGLLKRSGSERSDSSSHSQASSSQQHTPPPKFNHKRRHSSFGALRQVLRPSPDLDDMRELQSAIADQNERASSSSSSSPAPAPTLATMSDGRRPGKPQTIKVLQPSDFSRAPRAAPAAPGDVDADSTDSTSVDNASATSTVGTSPTEPSFISPESSSDTSSRATADTSMDSFETSSRDRSSSLFSNRPLSAWDSKVLANQLNATIARQEAHFSTRPLDGWDSRLLPLLARNDGALAKELRFSMRPDDGWDARLFPGGSSARERTDTTFSDRRISAWDGMLSSDAASGRGRSATTFSDRRASAWDGMLKSGKDDVGGSVAMGLTGVVDVDEDADLSPKSEKLFSARAPQDWDASLAPGDVTATGSDGKQSRNLIFSMRKPEEWDAALKHLKVVGDETPTQELRQNPIGQAH